MTDYPPFVISRTFDAPVDRVWDAWTKPDQIGTWMTPKGSGEMKMLAFDFRPGGVAHSTYVGPGGMGQLWGKFVYKAIEPKTKLVWEHSFSNAAGEITRHPMAPLWPEVLLTTVTFEPAGDDKTLLTLTWIPQGASEAEKFAFETARPGMQGGWGGSFEQLEEFLKDGF